MVQGYAETGGFHLDGTILFWVVMGILAFLMIRHDLQHQKPLKSLGFGVLSGVLTLFPVSYFLAQAGVNLAINGATLAFASVLGIPGVAGMAVFASLL